ncbi:MAG: hypothetical protein U0871_08915 [Gemmataceae bacterium]
MGVRWKPARWAAVLAVGATSAGPASAFYFKGWPGDGLRTPPSLIQPSAPSWANPPSVRTWTEPPPITRPPKEWTEEPNRPQQVPEPATLVLAPTGLAGGVCGGSGSASRQSQVLK